MANKLFNDKFSTQEIAQLNITPHLHTCQRRIVECDL